MKASAIKILSTALGLPCWQVRWDRQIGLDMNFGAPWMEIREPRVSTARSPRVRAGFARRRVMLRGSHWLVLSPGRWRLELADGLTVRDSSSVKRLDMAVARLEGEQLEGIAVHPRTGHTMFYFDLGAHIIVRGASHHGRAEEHELWSLHSRSRFVALYTGGHYDTGPLSIASDAQRPIGGADWLVVARTARRRREILAELHGAAV